MSASTSSQTVRWLHLSDFHVGKDDYANRKMFDYILRHVRQRKDNGFIPDFIFLTGDLANKGLESEYETFWLEFVNPLQEIFDSNISQRTFAVPGNHDADRSKHPAFSQDEISKPESHYLDPTPEGARLRNEMLIPRFKNYLDNDCTPTKNRLAASEGAFSEVVAVRDQKIGIVGINTAWLSKDDKDERKLTPGKPLLENALRKIQDTKLRIVLGHHPIDWFRPDQQKSIKSLLGEHLVLYLHGHLHDAWAEPTYGGGQNFLAIQAGSGFQAREGERWRNGLVWGEANLTSGEVRLQPCRWIAEQQAWTPATDAFHESHRCGDWWRYSIPCNQPTKVNYAPTTPQVQPPKGWSIFSAETLSSNGNALAPDEALRFFDGAVPDWRAALSSSIPRRQVVSRLVNRFVAVNDAANPIVTLLLAAGCEGKTTALLQAAYSVISHHSGWSILQRRDESQILMPDDLLPVLQQDRQWLIVLDEADNSANELLALLGRLPRELEGRVHALLACRDSDWRGSGADSIDWSNTASLFQERLEGLDQADSQAIVKAWQSYGEAGLGTLAEIPQEQRAQKLVEQAKTEAKTSGGAFFGALLTVRNGSDLRNHARLLLERLGQRKIPSGGTLRDALAYIAAMHAEDLGFLSRPVLAQALNCPLNKLHWDVLAPLGQEAAATSTSSYIYTRHRRIAETLISVFNQEFGEDINELYVQLSIAAIDAINAKRRLPENPREWRFNVSDHFFNKNQKELAFQIADAVLSREPQNIITRNHTANLYRRAKRPDLAEQCFLATPEIDIKERAFYYEWGVVKGECSHNAANIVLAAYSLCDQCSSTLVDNYNAAMGMSGLGVAFGALYEKYFNNDFRDARIAVAVLGQTLQLENKTRQYLQGHERDATDQGAIHPPNQEQAIQWLKAGLIAANEVETDDSVQARVGNVKDMTFIGLDKLLRAAAQASSQKNSP